MVKTKSFLKTKLIFFALIFAVWANPQNLFAPSMSFSPKHQKSIETLAYQASQKIQQEQRIRAMFKAFVRGNEKSLAFIPAEYRHEVASYCFEYHIPILLVYRWINKESMWYANATSIENSNGSVDRGLTQINSYSQNGLVKRYYTGKKPFNPYNYKDSLEVGIKYLYNLYRVYGSWEVALWAYNAGYGRVDRGMVPYTTQRYASEILLTANMSDSSKSS